MDRTTAIEIEQPVRMVIMLGTGGCPFLTGDQPSLRKGMVSGSGVAGLTRKRTCGRRSIIVEGVADGGTFTACIRMLRVRCSLSNSNVSHNSIGSREW